MRIFEHRIFSKSFGGKIRHNWTDVTYRIKKKTAHAYYKHPYFPKFFGGKNKNFWTALNTALPSDKKLFLKKSN